MPPNRAAPLFDRNEQPYYPLYDEERRPSQPIYPSKRHQGVDFSQPHDQNFYSAIHARITLGRLPPRQSQLEDADVYELMVLCHKHKRLKAEFLKENWSGIFSVEGLPLQARRQMGRPAIVWDDDDKMWRYACIKQTYTLCGAGHIENLFTTETLGKTYPNPQSRNFIWQRPSVPDCGSYRKNYSFPILGVEKHLEVKFDLIVWPSFFDADRSDGIFENWLEEARIPQHIRDTCRRSKMKKLPYWNPIDLTSYNLEEPGYDPEKCPMTAYCVPRNSNRVGAIPQPRSTHRDEAGAIPQPRSTHSDQAGAIRRKSKRPCDDQDTDMRDMRPTNKRLCNNNGSHPNRLSPQVTGEEGSPTLNSQYVSPMDNCDLLSRVAAPLCKTACEGERLATLKSHTARSNVSPSVNVGQSMSEAGVTLTGQLHTIVKTVADKIHQFEHEIRDYLIAQFQTIERSSTQSNKHSPHRRKLHETGRGPEEQPERHRNTTPSEDAECTCHSSRGGTAPEEGRYWSQTKDAAESESEEED